MMNATEEHNFKLKIAMMTKMELERAIDTGQYQEPYLSIARASLSTRSTKDTVERHRWQVFLQALQFSIALLALIVAILAYFK